MSETTVPKIYTAIPAVLEEVGAVGKNRRNEQQGYAYRSCDDICDALRPLLGKHGIFPTKKILEKAEEDRTARSGGNLNWVKLKCEWTFHASDGSSITTETFGEGMDSGDKAWNKAETGSMKNALLQIFLVMGHEDSEVDSPEPEPRQQQRHNDDRRDHDRGGGQQRQGQRQGQQQRRQNDPMPDCCPKCGSTNSIHRKRGGGFVCYKSQGGCEHEWTSAAQVAAQTPGVTTGDKIPPPAQKSVYELALETISNAVQLKDVNMLRNVEARIIERVEDKSLTEQQFQSLGLKLSEAEEAIKAATN